MDNIPSGLRLEPALLPRGDDSEEDAAGFRLVQPSALALVGSPPYLQIRALELNDVLNAI